ncbi:MAG: hypothetical protein ABSH13_20085 [Candidatus Acidiferrum sp.]
MHARSRLAAAGIPKHARGIHVSGTRIAHNVARESCGPVATIDLFEARRTAGQQATHLGRIATQRECARALLREGHEATNNDKWIADYETGY